MPIDVSVIVPVYNPGAYIHPLLDCLDRQSIGGDRLEAIFVDDGSTDETPALLDAWAATRPNVTVIHQANHGWPGQPRNAGIQIARGRYIQFVDQDDWLGDTALAELVAFADTNQSDVIVGKMVGINRTVPKALFRKTVPRVVIGRDPIQDSQTPHKMFRRAFLDEIGLRFPEGKRRLEDHVFVTNAYLQAKVVSVYADTDCYFHISRPDGGNAGYRAYDPVAYYRAVDEVLDIIDRHLPDAAVRDAYAVRWLRTELIGRLHERQIRALPRARRHAFFDEISRVVRTRYTPRGIGVATRPIRIGAFVTRHATAREWDRFARAIADITVAAARDDGIRVYLRGRELPRDAGMSVLLRRTVPRVADAVLADLGDDIALVPDGADRDVKPGTTLTVKLAVGDRSCTVAATPPGRRDRLVRRGRGLVGVARHRASQVLRRARSWRAARRR